MASSLRGPDKAERDCTRCHFRKQTCDRVLPRCTRCTEYDPLGRIECKILPAPTYPVAQAPQPEEPLVQFKRDNWRFTDRGEEQLGKLLLKSTDLWNSVPEGIGKFVETLISNHGRTIDELLQDDIFKWFPIVEPCYMDKYASRVQIPSFERHPDRFLPLLHMAILLVTSPPPLVIPLPVIMDGPALHTDLYKATKALFAVVTGTANSHAHLIQTLGLIALYEFGIGSFEQAHMTLNSALAMTSLSQDYLLDIEAQLTWKLCLMTLDRMIAMSSHSRICHSTLDYVPNRLPLICDSNHPLSKEVENLMKRYEYSARGRNSEEAIQRLHAMYEGVARAGRILQRNKGKEESPFYDSDSEFDLDIGQNGESARNKTDGLEEDKRAMMGDNGNPKAPDYWSGHDPQVLSLSAMLVNEYYEGRPKDGQLIEPRWRRADWRGNCEDVALKACTRTLTMSRKKGVDVKQLSMVSMFCIIHNLTIMVKDPASDFAVKKAKDFKSVMNKFSKRWPFVETYLLHLKQYIDNVEDLHEVRCYD